MGYEWKNFLDILNRKSGWQIEVPNGKCGKDNIIEFFKSKAFQVRWFDLESTLLAMEYETTVNYIQKNFLYTQGIFSYSSSSSLLILYFLNLSHLILSLFMISLHILLLLILFPLAILVLSLLLILLLFLRLLSIT